jgi:hypothetical protein
MILPTAIITGRLRKINLRLKRDWVSVSTLTEVLVQCLISSFSFKRSNFVIDWFASVPTINSGAGIFRYSMLTILRSRKPRIRPWGRLSWPLHIRKSWH